MKSASVFLVVLTVSHGCKIDNIDQAEPTVIPIQTSAECEEKAAILDAKIGQRAFCFSSAQEAPND